MSELYRMAAAVQDLGHQDRADLLRELHGQVERNLRDQLPGAGYRMPLATMINLWDIYGHMKGKTYPTIESLLDDAAEGWKSWREDTPLSALTNAEETAIIKAVLARADIHPKRVRHYLGPLIIEMVKKEMMALMRQDRNAKRSCQL